MYKQLLLLIAIIALSQSVQYNPEKSKEFLYYCKTTFCEQADIKDWSCEACEFNQNGIKSVKVVDNKEDETRAIVIYNQEQNKIIIAFRGSDNKDNWEQDFDFALIDYPPCKDCKVHEGFYKDWQGLKSEVMEEYYRLQKLYPNAESVITGHSLGAALAVVSAFSFVEEGNTLDYLYTFGCPRPGNQEFVTFGHKLLPQAVRVTHYRDPVPHTPYKSWGYLQLPTEVWYYEKDSELYKICDMPGVEEDPDCSDKMLNDIWIDHDFYLGIYIGCENEKPDTKKYEYQQQQNLRRIDEK